MRLNSFRNKITCLLAGTLLAGTALAGNGALLGVQVDYPRINFTPASTAQTVSYNGTTLSISSTPVFVTFTSGGTAEFVMSGSLSLTATINASGVLSGGSFSISGSVTDTATSTNYSGTLLAGTVDDYGIADIGGPGGTDLADFDLTATSGSLKARFDAVNTNAAMVVTLEGSGYSGSFTSSWSAARAKGDVGPQPPFPEQPPHTIGYWKTHPEAWPVQSLVICGNTLTKSEAIDVLKTPPRGDKTLIMAKQLIAAMLNVAVGNSCPLIPAAETWLCDHGGIGASRKEWDGGEVLHDELDEFNNGTGDCTL